ncbi:serine hydrolase [Nonomuraea sp. NPDC049695]|uniref:serine hydrolase n=1 Tax=Nonomuraea sp. NPDC049695 TaxID=3154734 RepID=UPI00341A6117
MVWARQEAEGTANLRGSGQPAARQRAARDTKTKLRESYSLGRHGGWGFGMAVRIYRGDFASIGRFGWDGGTGTSAYADPDKQVTGVLPTQIGMSTADAPRLIHGFWTTVYQAIDD